MSAMGNVFPLPVPEKLPEATNALKRLRVVSFGKINSQLHLLRYTSPVSGLQLTMANCSVLTIQAVETHRKAAVCYHS